MMVDRPLMMETGAAVHLNQVQYPSLHATIGWSVDDRDQLRLGRQIRVRGP